MRLGASMRRTMLLFLIGLFLICMCSLMLQIMETRLLSVMAWYYLAFFAISMAMFGMTAGSLFVYFKASLFPPMRLLEHLSWIGSAFAIAVVISTLSMVSTVVLAGLTSAMMALLWFKVILIILTCLPAWRSRSPSPKALGRWALSTVSIWSARRQVVCSCSDC